VRSPTNRLPGCSERIRSICWYFTPFGVFGESRYDSSRHILPQPEFRHDPPIPSDFGGSGHFGQRCSHSITRRAAQNSRQPGSAVAGIYDETAGVFAALSQVDGQPSPREGERWDGWRLRIPPTSPSNGREPSGLCRTAVELILTDRFNPEMPAAWISFRVRPKRACRTLPRHRLRSPSVGARRSWSPTSPGRASFLDRI